MKLARAAKQARKVETRQFELQVSSHFVPVALARYTQSFKP